MSMGTLTRGTTGPVLACLTALGFVVFVSAVGGEEGQPAKETPKAPEPAKLDLNNVAKSLSEPEKPAEAAPSPPTGKDAPITLRYKYAVNEVTYYSVDHTMRITSQKNQSTETADNSSNAIKHYRVVSVDPDGSALLELVIDRVKMTAQFGENDPVSFDSESSKVCPPQFERVRESVGKPLARVKVAPTGELLNVVRTQAPTAPGGETPDNDPSNNFLIPLPKNPVKAGESWTDQIEVKVTVSRGLSRNIAILRRYDLKSIEGDIATIAAVSTVVTPVKDAKINGQLIQRTPAGTILFDVKSGRIVSREMKSDKTEIGVFDDNSSMRAVSQRTEKLLTRDEALRTAKSGDEPAKN